MEHRSAERFDDECIPTLNNTGFQLSKPSTLCDDCLRSYDGKHPLLDVGCAYGINTFVALTSDIPTIALDMEERHLQILKNNTDPKTPIF